MKKMVFESKVLPDGHLYCPDKIAREKDAHFKVIVTFGKKVLEASEHEVELSAISDVSEDFLSEEELEYYLNTQNKAVNFF